MKSISALPTGWIQMPLGTCGTWHGGGTPSKFNESYWTKGTIPWISPKDMKTFRITDSEDHLAQVAIEETNVKLFPSGTVLVVIRSGILSRTLPVAVSQVIGTMNQDLKGLCPADGIDSDFVAYFLQAFEQDILRKCSKHGTTVASIDTASLHSYPLSIAPLNEQRRIVAKIEELFSDLDAGIAALKRAKANLKRYRASVLKAAVEGKLTEEWRAKHPAKEPASELLARILKERRQKWESDQLAKFAASGKQPPKNWRDKYVEPQPPETNGLPDLPDDWCWATLGQLLHRIEGGKSFECLTRPAEPNEWGVVKVSAMTWGTFLEDEQKAIPPAAEFDPDDEIRPNDLLLSRSNTPQLVGATVLVGNCRPRLLLSDKSLRLRAIETVNLHWLHMVLSSSVARRQLSAMATGTSDSMRNVSQDKIKSVVFPLPPLAEQQWIVEVVSERLSQIDAAELQIEHGLLRAARLRQSILKRAFEGKLVPQDPSDEPASVLLERLRASRSHEGAKDKPATGNRTLKTSPKSK